MLVGVLGWKRSCWPGPRLATDSCLRRAEDGRSDAQDGVGRAGHEAGARGLYLIPPTTWFLSPPAAPPVRHPHLPPSCSNPSLHASVRGARRPFADLSPPSPHSHQETRFSGAN